MSGSPGVVAKRVLFIEPNNQFFRANSLLTQETAPSVEASSSNSNLSSIMSVNNNTTQRQHLSPQQQQQQEAVTVENILDRTMATLDRLSLPMDRLESVMEFRQQQRPGHNNQLNMSMLKGNLKFL